jgi:ABC-2 type transport system ATP-binding protein
MESAVTFDRVTKRYKSKCAVENLSFSIERGTVVALLGPNGAGKTTSISMMLGLRAPSSGTVRVFGVDPRVPANRRHIGAMLQQVNLPQGLTVLQVINMFRAYYPNPLSADQLLEYADLKSEAKWPATRLSGGQKRRLEFALAMAGNPNLLFLDEPTTAMDVASRRAFWEQLRAYAKEGRRTIVLTTHHLEEADAIADRILVLQEGRLIADGSPAQLKQQAGNRFVSFTAGPHFDERVLRGMPGVEVVECTSRRWRIRTRNSDDLLRRLIAGNHDVKDFEVTAGALEDAFVYLTESTARSAM